MHQDPFNLLPWLTMESEAGVPYVYISMGRARATTWSPRSVRSPPLLTFSRCSRRAAAAPTRVISCLASGRKTFFVMDCSPFCPVYSRIKIYRRARESGGFRGCPFTIGPRCHEKSQMRSSALPGNDRRSWYAGTFLLSAWDGSLRAYCLIGHIPIYRSIYRPPSVSI